jgi:transcriptional regulator of arginine metabolism
MSRDDRHAAIREFLRTTRISSQEQLRELLLARGFDVAQATLSRDMRQLRLVKGTDVHGRPHYQLPAEETAHVPPLIRLLPALFLSAESAGNLLVIRTLTGGAQPVAEAIDWQEWPEVLGTIGGDDTILVVLRDPAEAPAIQRRLEELAGEL